MSLSIRSIKRKAIEQYSRLKSKAQKLIQNCPTLPSRICKITKYTLAAIYILTGLVESIRFNNSLLLDEAFNSSSMLSMRNVVLISYTFIFMVSFVKKPRNGFVLISNHLLRFSAIQYVACYTLKIFLMPAMGPVSISSVNPTVAPLFLAALPKKQGLLQRLRSWFSGRASTAESSKLSKIFCHGGVVTLWFEDMECARKIKALQDKLETYLFNKINNNNIGGVQLLSKAITILSNKLYLNQLMKYEKHLVHTQRAYRFGWGMVITVVMNVPYLLRIAVDWVPNWVLTDQQRAAISHQLEQFSIWHQAHILHHLQHGHPNIVVLIYLGLPFIIGHFITSMNPVLKAGWRFLRTQGVVRLRQQPAYCLVFTWSALQLEINEEADAEINLFLNVIDYIREPLHEFIRQHCGNPTQPLHTGASCLRDVFGWVRPADFLEVTRNVVA